MLAFSSVDGTSRSITLTPLGTQFGTANITLTVTDTNLPVHFSSVTVPLNVVAPPTNTVGSGPITLSKTGASEYPIPFDLSNLIGGVYDVSVELRGLSYTDPANLDILLVSPDGTNAVMLMSGAGGINPVAGLDVIFDGEASTAVPISGTFTSGTYLASYYTGGKHPLPSPAPTNSPTDYSDTLSTFQDRALANGTWNLYIHDLTDGASGPDSGSISNGVYLTVTTRPVITVTNNPLTIAEDGSYTLYYTVSDTTIAPTNLLVSASGGNKGVMPTTPPSVVVNQPNANGVGTVVLTPLSLQYNDASFTLNVTRTNDNVSGSVKMTVTVTPTNFPPVVYRLLTNNVSATTTTDIQILISDADTPLGNLSLTAVSQDEGIISTPISYSSGPPITRSRG